MNESTVNLPESIVNDLESKSPNFLDDNMNPFEFEVLKVIDKLKAEDKPKKKRGRPAKVKTEGEVVEDKPKKKRGRPAKVKAEGEVVKVKESKPKKIKGEYTDVIHCKYRPETGHWVLFGELKSDPSTLCELRKFTKIDWTLGAWRRSSKIKSAKQDTCHVWVQDGSKIDYTLIRGTQEYKTGVKKGRKAKVVTGAENGVSEKPERTFNPYTVTVVGCDKLEGLSKEGTVLSKGRITVVEFSSPKESTKYTLSFNSKTGLQLDPQPFHSWKINKG